MPLDAQRRNDVTSITNEVKKNILILLRFIDAVCSSANKELPFQGHDESSIYLETIEIRVKKSLLHTQLILSIFR